MRTPTHKGGLPKLSDDEIAERLSMALARGSLTSLEALRRRSALQRVKARATERAIERRKGGTEHETQAELKRLGVQLTRYRSAADDAEIDEHLARARAKLGSVIGQRASAYGRVTDSAGHGRAKVHVEIASKDGKPVARSTTDEQGYFAVAAPEGLTSDLELRIAADESPHVVPLTRAGKPLPAARVRLQSSSDPKPGHKPKPAPKPTPTPKPAPKPASKPTTPSKPITPPKKPHR